MGPVEPMYIPGRSRTGSRPLRTVMSLALYATRAYPFERVRRNRLSAGVLQTRPGRENRRSEAVISVAPVYQSTPRNRWPFAGLFGGELRGPRPTATRIAARTGVPTRRVRALRRCRLRGTAIASPSRVRRRRSCSSPSRTARARVCGATSSPTIVRPARPRASRARRRRGIPSSRLQRGRAGSPSETGSLARVASVTAHPTASTIRPARRCGARVRRSTPAGTTPAVVTTSGPAARLRDERVGPLRRRAR